MCDFFDGNQSRSTIVLHLHFVTSCDCRLILFFCFFLFSCAYSTPSSSYVSPPLICLRFSSSCEKPQTWLCDARLALLPCEGGGTASSPAAAARSLEALPAAAAAPTSSKGCDDDDDVTDSLLGGPKEGAVGGGAAAAAATHNGRKRQLHIKDGGDGATTTVTAYQDDVKIGDGMDIAIQGENGKTPHIIPLMWLLQTLQNLWAVVCRICAMGKL